MEANVRFNGGEVLSDLKIKQLEHIFKSHTRFHIFWHSTKVKDESRQTFS